MPTFARHGSAKVLLVIAASIVAAAGCDSQSSEQKNSAAQNDTPSTTGVALAVGQNDPKPSAAVPAAGDQPRPKLRPGAKTKVLAKAGDKPYDKTFDDLRFTMTVGEKFKRSMLTSSIEELNGQRIRIRGYILPTPQKHGIQQFVLVRDNQECCFGPGAALYDCILIEMKAGSTADFTIRPIAVEGKFNVRQVSTPDGVDLAIYQMDGESAQ